MKLVSYETKKEEVLKSAFISKHSYSVLGGALAGEMGTKPTGNNKGRIFTNELFESFSKKPKGEMGVAELKKLVQQAIIDIATEQVKQPTLYKDIYEEINDSSFPQSLEVKDIIGLQTAFGIVGDGEAVPLADFKCKDLGTVHFKTMATGYSITEEWVTFNQAWKIEQANKAIGQAHQAILDHIHLSPIINATYKDEKITNKVSKATDTALQVVYNSLRKGLKDTMTRRNSHGYILKPSIALCNSATALDVMSAIKGEVEKGQTFGNLGMIEKVIAYDGWVGKVNGINYCFEAPKENEVFLIDAKKGFKALVKKELTKLEQRGNTLTLSNMEVAHYFIRAVIADIAGSCHKVIVG